MSTAAFTTLVANVGRIDAIRTFADGRQISSFSAAVTRRFKSKGQTVEETDWYTVKTTSPHLISLIDKHVDVGDQLIINGALSINTYERNDGTKGTQVEVFASDIRFNLAKKKPGSEASTGQASGSDLDDEIPF
ncbi:single-stranded DNA-binding protein [Asticcacaulis sp. YBE204]|uniref:single-stranded DNA-binding protein n=1 Tax=Asticcacaulis sp. YBE204 TaxID=1282363 RepID=UPI0003C40175|nr:single-stranded DNA-binding protein [Asticcacaulis sp. YBE204]ESQ79255.1 hypothetical protein AEYBE204_09605 [Asticcacaulis sp. YBE204]